MNFIGVDLHANSLTICRFEADGPEQFEAFPLAQAELDRFCQGLDADDEIAVEATGNRGRITKRGDKPIRTTLGQRTLIAGKYAFYLDAFGQRIKERQGAGQAIIATTRKRLSIIYATPCNGWILDDFTQFKIKQNQCPDGHST
ncbi:MAG: hypothetical protein CR964_00725 [Rhodobacterales bacterium]|nr:MAG: hypothetical protein CR964_00725 [Rhodobacterales bacterium]